MVKSAALLTFGNAATALFTLVRNILIARLIPVEDYGIASTFVITMALIEMISQLGLDRMIVQDQRGDRAEFQSGLHMFQLFMGLAGAAFFLVIAVPYAGFLNLEHLVWAYALIAVVPLMTGLWHFDMFRAQRSMSYAPYVFAQVVPAFVSLLVVWPLYWAFGDWQVMLYAILLQQGLILLLSHLTAKRRYRWALDRGLLREALAFGWPLLVNGALLFLVFNGEKMIVGRELGMAPLALFAMAFSLTLTPTLVLARSAQSFFLPQLSRVQDNDQKFAPLSYAMLQTSLLIGLLLVIGVVLVGPPFVHLALGEKYAPMLSILVWLGIAQALRVSKTGVAVVSLARARTRNAMIANSARVAALPIAWGLVVWGGGGMGEIIAVAIVAELVGMGIALWLVRTEIGLALQPMVPVLALIAVTFLAVAAVTVAVPPAPGILAHLHPWHLAWILPALASLAAMTHLRSYVMKRRGV